VERSGVHQWSVLELFIFYVNDMNDKVKKNFWKFANDAKLIKRADTGVEVNQLQ